MALRFIPINVIWYVLPAIGAVNAMSSNYNFVAQVDTTNGFGSYDMKISNRKAAPSIWARGRITSFNIITIHIPHPYINFIPNPTLS